MIFSHVYGSHWEEFSLLFFGADCLFSLFYFLFVFLDVFSFLYGRIAYSFRVSGVINGLSVNRTFFFFLINNTKRRFLMTASLSLSLSLI